MAQESGLLFCPIDPEICNSVYSEYNMDSLSPGKHN